MRQDALIDNSSQKQTPTGRSYESVSPYGRFEAYPLLPRLRLLRIQQQTYGNQLVTSVFGP